MKKLLLFALLAFMFVECTKDSGDPLPELESVVGKWLPVSFTGPDGETVVFKDNEVDFMEIRSDGVMLNKSGYSSCCSPKSYKVNGVQVNVKPQTPVESDPSCMLVNCMTCPDMRITKVSDNEIISEYCGQNSTRFVRVQ